MKLGHLADAIARYCDAAADFELSGELIKAFGSYELVLEILRRNPGIPDAEQTRLKIEPISDRLNAIVRLRPNMKR